MRTKSQKNEINADEFKGIKTTNVPYVYIKVIIRHITFKN